jgi:hypothetical protein
MNRSVNQSQSITDKHRARYGNRWASIDFFINKHINLREFQMTPMSCKVGVLRIGKTDIVMEYKDLKNVSMYIKHVRFLNRKATHKISIQILGKDLSVTQHELFRIYETLQDTQDTVLKAYRLGIL